MLAKSVSGAWEFHLTKTTNLKSASPNNHVIVATISNEGTWISTVKWIEFYHVHIILTIHSVGSVSSRILLHFQRTKSRYHGSDVFSRMKIHIPTQKFLKARMTHCMNKKCKVFVAEQIKISYNLLKNTKAALKLIRCSLFVLSIKIFTTLNTFRTVSYRLQQ